MCGPHTLQLLHRRHEDPKAQSFHLPIERIRAHVTICIIIQLAIES